MMLASASATTIPSGCRSWTSTSHPRARAPSGVPSSTAMLPTLATDSATTLRGGGSVETHGRGHRQVQRLGTTVDRHADDLVAGVAHLRFEAPGLVAHDPRVRRREVHVMQQVHTGAVR